MEYLDVRIAPKFREEFKKLIDRQDGPAVVIDLTTVQFIDSAGYGALIALLKYCKEKNRELFLYNLSPFAEDAFKMLNLDKLFNLTLKLPPK